MKISLLFAMLAGIAWGIGGYFEKSGLKELGLPSITSITLRTMVALVVLGLLSLPAWKSITFTANVPAWLMIIIGGGIVAGSLGMWSFYSALSTSENLGITLAVAFAFSPVAGTVLGLIRGDQPMDLRLALGLVAIIGGIILVQTARTQH